MSHTSWQKLAESARYAYKAERMMYNRLDKGLSWHVLVMHFFTMSSCRHNEADGCMQILRMHIK